MESSSPEKQLNGLFSDDLIARLEASDDVTVFSGAGMSAESGVPTFRGEDGIWKKFRPEELANFDAFMRNPTLVWQWYDYRKTLIAGLQPNPGHLALVEMESRHKRLSVITQNIDNLHRRAGTTTIHELHGNIERNYCTGCGKYFTNDELARGVDVPRCKACGSLIRPDVVWFGEMLPVIEWDAAVVAAERADIFFSIGTSSVVYPAASLPTMAKRSGAYVVEINIERTEFSHHADEVLVGKSGEILPRLLDSYRQRTLHT